MMRAETNRNERLIAEYGHQKRIAGLIQNGITPEDVRKEYERGERDGFREATMTITKSCYAAIVLALKDEFEFDDEQCYKALLAVDHRILYSIEHFELAEEVLAKTGLEIQMEDPISRVARKV
jgi:hypothetical protein